MSEKRGKESKKKEREIGGRLIGKKNWVEVDDKLWYKGEEGIVASKITKGERRNDLYYQFIIRRSEKI